MTPLRLYANIHSPREHGARLIGFDRRHTSPMTDPACRAVPVVVLSAGAYDRLIEAMRQLAAFDDAGACRNLAEHGNYGSFDSPGTVKAVRELLADPEICAP